MTTKSLSPEQARNEYAPFIGRNLFYEMIRDGRIRHFRCGERRILIPRDAMEEWLQNGGNDFQVTTALSR